MEGWQLLGFAQIVEALLGSVLRARDSHAPFEGLETSWPQQQLMPTRADSNHCS